MEQAEIMEKMAVPVRDSTMAVHHFGQSLKAFGFKASPTLREIADHNKLRAARRLFDDTFSDAKEARNAVAHSAELTKDKTARDRNAFSGGYSSRNIEIPEGVTVNMTVIDENAFVATKGTPHEPAAVVRSNLGRAELEMLVKIAEIACEAFTPAVEKGFADSIDP